jgi:hypothetical protein
VKAPFNFIFIWIWLPLVVAGILLLHVNRNVKIKRMLMPWYLGLGAVIFIVMLVTMKWPIPMIAVFAVIVIAISYMNYKTIQFCDRCGRTITPHVPFSKPEFCPKCGATLRIPQADTNN